MTQVYFIKPIGKRGPVKIGCSFAPDGRKSTLQCWSPYPLEIVATLNGYTVLERRFHAKFVALHTHSEWFRWSKELQATIDAINDGTFDINILPSPERLPRKAILSKRKWSDEQRRGASQTAIIRRIRKELGYVLIGEQTQERIEAFIADPKAAGVPEAEAQFMWRAEYRKNYEKQIADAQGRIAEVEQWMAERCAA